ncbi:hypothetical protein ASPWEDRAFT_171875 [Aspergillus wentii DTO 134E9]|uniref:Uncharacterized protein n=1 Tax=Aspergillus wentii DTO 134E9 TaxID=1073089 RepID=A0A1L9RJM2_ASPWE|nr:uncharacterized protein ASPWEDRAFT_171875 [Aspergillus wentii DTO 134E9]KAI9931997.1 hypothetical protein MW887_009500 [Aspergillus wentii]OJJ35047.1 hypothetical protein ASPWEDRAFT_171875 [Aspergillus wentii DTO 134E9]
MSENLTERITNPKHIQDLKIDLTSLSNASESPTQRQPIELVLLQPLSDPDLLEACRNPDSQIRRRPNGVVCGTSNQEFLDIGPLSKAWREALLTIPPISNLVFNLALPKEAEKRNGSFQKVYWVTAMPQEPSVGVHLRDAMALVITIATEMKIRVDGDVFFEAIYE